MRRAIVDLRRLFWHLRHGGLKQVAIWRQRARAEAGIRSLDSVRGAEGAWVGRGRRRRLAFKPANVAADIGSDGRIRAATILDSFSSTAFGAEWACTSLKPGNWRDELVSNPPDVLFVESAWFGERGLWRGKITGPDHTISTLKEVVHWCTAREIPTVFWNKEDPIHYAEFLPAAKLFDWVYTTDASRVPDYFVDLGHKRVGVLPFAAQPRLHNPARPRYGWHERDIAFGGMYFAEKYPERRSQMELLLGAAVEASSRLETGLEIFSRQFGGAAKYQFPSPFSEYVVGSLPYEQMLTAYKAYKIFLNVNTVVNSPSMCSRRVFEILASGTTVITAPSQAIDHFFSHDEIFIGNDKDETVQLLLALTRNPSVADRQVHRAQRRIWENHTYKHRANAVIESVLPARYVSHEKTQISALVCTNRPHRIVDVFRTIQAQAGVDIELVLLTHGFTLSGTELEELMSDHDVHNVRYLSATADVPLGSCLNMCVEMASGEVLTKMDDDDFYAANYLRDLINALEYSGADIVGKQAHFMHLESINGTLFRFPDREHRWTGTVMGPTITGRAEVFKRCPFPALTRGEDTGFLQSVSRAGYSIYSSDRFNYCQRRSSESHTWQITEMKLLSQSSIDFFGSVEDHISI